MTPRAAATLVSPPDPATLDAMLTRLKLTAIRDQLDTLLAEAARRELTLIETVAYLCEREIARKDARRIDMACIHALRRARAGGCGGEESEEGNRRKRSAHTESLREQLCARQTSALIFWFDRGLRPRSLPAARSARLSLLPGATARTPRTATKLRARGAPAR